MAARSRDNNMRAAVIHVMADAAVSVLVIIGLLLARAFGWLWMDPLAGIIGACVIASWSYGLIRDTGAILLDMNPDPNMASKLRQAIEAEGDQLSRSASLAAGAGPSRRDRLRRHEREPREADYYRAGWPASARCRTSPSRLPINRDFELHKPGGRGERWT